MKIAKIYNEKMKIEKKPEKKYDYLTTLEANK
jgi:hypothetical protein